tara:strand:+ start:38553 stop:39653 length:1101 start_codon:yes stop_codon:yes gene_type:complete
MASTFKTLLNNDVVNTRTLLHESIPVTGTIASGTYQNTPGTELNIKTFSHGMFQSVYDYPFLSSSANHIFDVSYGYSSAASASANIQNSKKLNIYNQMAQVLMGYNESGSIRKFDSDGTLDDNTGIMNQCFFVNFSRLLTKDEIKKNSFRIGLHLSGAVDGNGSTRKNKTTIGDYLSANQFRTSPAGDYGLLFTGSSAQAGEESQSVGLVFYQAGVVVLTSAIFLDQFGTPASFAAGEGKHNPAHALASATGTGIKLASTGSTIDTLAGGFRHRIHNISFNNTIELNSTIYFCRANHNEFNYSSNPTYVNSSKIVVKNNVNDLPLSYITTVGLYSADNEMLAVAKLSEPIRKDPNTELTLRVRLDY